MRPDSIQAMTKAAISEPVVSSPPQASREANAAKAMSVGSPTEMSQGASCAVEEPVMRSMPSDQRVTSFASLAVMCLVMEANLLRSRPTQLAPSWVCAMTIA